MFVLHTAQRRVFVAQKLKGVALLLLAHMMPLLYVVMAIEWKTRWCIESNLKRSKLVFIVHVFDTCMWCVCDPYGVCGTLYVVCIWCVVCVVWCVVSTSMYMVCLH